MQGTKGAVEHHRRGLFRRIAESLLHFFMRSQTSVNRPPTEVPEVLPLPDNDRLMRGRKQQFYGELFAELLIELPLHRRRLARACESGDIDTLRNAVHQLLGAVAYCDAPELEDALRELQRAIKTGDQYTIDICQERAVNVIDSTLRYSGYRSHG